MAATPRTLTPHASLWDFFGAELRHRREAAGWSLDELAQRVLSSNPPGSRTRRRFGLKRAGIEHGARFGVRAGLRTARTPRQFLVETYIVVKQESGSVRKLASYLRIAASLREDINSGRLAPGGRLPSETQLTIRHRVSRSVAKRAISVLKEDGLVDGRQGSGVFVRLSHRVTREPGWPAPLADPGGGSQPSWPQSLPGALQADPWSYLSEEIQADAVVARRLAIRPGQPVMRTLSRYTTEDTPPDLLLVTSWQPVTAPSVGDDPVRRPDELCEQIIVRGATPDEITRLYLPSRGLVLAITRTHTAGGMPMETADIVMPSDRYQLSYRMTIE